MTKGTLHQRDAISREKTGEFVNFQRDGEKSGLNPWNRGGKRLGMSWKGCPFL
jgi:hypothetical protein